MGFEELVAEGVAVPVAGWDFSWFEGRASEQRPSWGYGQLLSERLSNARSALDIQTGGGEGFAWSLERAPRRSRQLAVTEGWPPNAALAKRRLSRLGVGVVRADEVGPLPFRHEVFQLVSSRHPLSVVWEEIARVLEPGGTFFSQMVGAGSDRELYEYLMSPQADDHSRSPDLAVASAEAAGLQLVDLRVEALDVALFDIAAVVHFLRKVPWTVPDFTVERYHDRLVALHAAIQRDRQFMSHSHRYLIELRR